MRTNYTTTKIDIYETVYSAHKKHRELCIIEFTYTTMGTHLEQTISIRRWSELLSTKNTKTTGNIDVFNFMFAKNNIVLVYFYLYPVSILRILYRFR